MFCAGFFTLRVYFCRLVGRCLVDQIVVINRRVENYVVQVFTLLQTEDVYRLFFWAGFFTIVVLFTFFFDLTSLPTEIEA